MRRNQPFMPWDKAKASRSAFLRYYTHLRPNAQADGLTATEAMFVLQLLELGPVVTNARLGARLGLRTRQVRAIARRLDELGFVKRTTHSKRGTHYSVLGLVAALKRIEEAAAAGEVHGAT